jgi:hypothetical protein
MLTKPLEDAGFVNNEGNEVILSVTREKGCILKTLKFFGYQKSTTAQRRYDGLEFVVEKRLSSNWYFNATTHLAVVR